MKVTSVRALLALMADCTIAETKMLLGTTYMHIYDLGRVARTWPDGQTVGVLVAFERYQNALKQTT